MSVSVPDILDLSALKSTGIQEGEELMPDPPKQASEPGEKLIFYSLES